MTTKEFIAKLTPENTELLGKMQVVKTPEDAYAIAKAEGVTDSFDAFTEEMTNFHDSVKELSEEDLDMVAGGMSEEAATAIVTVFGSASVTVTIATAASAI